MNAYFTTAYLPPVSYIQTMLRSEKVFLEADENYLKQSYRNRCNILSANGVMPLSIPVEKISGEKLSIRDVKISSHNDWQVQHWKSIVSAYNSSPFFEYYEADFYPFYHKKWKYLWDYNSELLALLCQLLDVEIDISLTQEYIADYGVERDFRHTISPKKSAVCGLKPYYQIFEQRFGFTPDMSIIDLLFNMGNESILILNSKK